MAKRFGGKYSPDGSSDSDKLTQEPPAYKGAQVAPAGARSNVIFVPGLILAFTSINEAPTAMAGGLLGAGTLILGRASLNVPSER